MSKKRLGPNAPDLKPHQEIVRENLNQYTWCQTFTEAAEAVGLGRSQLSMFISGARGLGPKSLDQLARATEIPVCEWTRAYRRFPYSPE